MRAHRQCVKKGGVFFYKLWGRRPSVSTVQPLGHYYPRAITHTRAGASFDTQHRIAVHFITPIPSTHTNLEVLPWVIVSPEYRRAAVHMRTKAQPFTASHPRSPCPHCRRSHMSTASAGEELPLEPRGLGPHFGTGEGTPAQTCVTEAFGGFFAHRTPAWIEHAQFWNGGVVYSRTRTRLLLYTRTRHQERHSHRPLFEAV